MCDAHELIFCKNTPRGLTIPLLKEDVVSGRRAEGEEGLLVAGIMSAGWGGNGGFGRIGLGVVGGLSGVVAVWKGLKCGFRGMRSSPQNPHHGGFRGDEDGCDDGSVLDWESG